MVALTATGSWMSQMDEDKISLCQLDNGALVNGKRPSVESLFHREILKCRPEVDVVLHYQSPWATTIACGEPGAYDYYIIPEVPFYIGRPAVVEYLAPGSVELAEAVIEAMRSHDLAILRNHGLVVVGKDFDDVIQKAMFFELACQVLLTGEKFHPLGPDAVDALQQRAAGQRSGNC